MTPLLQQAREAIAGAEAILSLKASEIWPGKGEARDEEIRRGMKFLDSMRAALTALDTYEALSPYDKAIHDLAKYLPDGWYAQAPYSTETLLFYKEKPVMLTGTIETWEAIGKSVGLTSVPWHFTWRESPREIRSGRVLQQGEV